MLFADFRRMSFVPPFKALRIPLLLTLLAAPPVLAQIDPTAQQPKKSQPDTTPKVMQIIPIKHALAHELAGVVSQSMRVGVNVAVDERTNSLIVSAMDQSQLEQIRVLIEEIDRPAAQREQTDTIAQFFRLPRGMERHVNSIRDAAQDLVGRGSSVSIAASTLVFRGSPESLERIRSLMEALQNDAPEAGAASHPVTFSFYVLASGEAANKTPAPEALKSVTGALAESGFPSMYLLAPLQINSSTSNDQFELTASADAQTDVRIKGVVSASGENGLQLRFDGSVVAMVDTSRRTALEVNSTIQMRLGEYVVLAAAPTAGMQYRSLAIVVRAMPAAR